MVFRSEKYIMSSEFATLKNEEVSEISLTIPNNFSVPMGQTKTFEVFKDIGTKNSAIRTLIRTSKYPDKWRPGKSFFAPVTMSIAGFQSESELTVYVERVSHARVRLCADVSNFAGAGQTANFTNASQTITAKIATFKSPFEN